MGIVYSCCNKDTQLLNDSKSRRKENFLESMNPSTLNSNFHQSKANSNIDSERKSIEESQEKQKINMLNAVVLNPVDFDLIGLNNKKEEILTLSNSNKKKFDFSIICLLGSGSFGKVYLVRYLKNRKVYALKVIEKKMVKAYNFRSQTLRERALLEEIQSPFVVRLHFAFQSTDNLFLVTEFGQGGELFYHLMVFKYFSENRIKLYLAEIILALEAMHKKKCFYRDLKPENILVDAEGHIKITDFGLSKIESSAEKQSFSIVGTPGYFAPEILFQSYYDHRVDYWSLGVVLYIMMEGKHPFDPMKRLNPSKKNKEKLRELLIGLTPIYSVNKKFSQNLKDLCSKLLAFDPKNRPFSSSELKGHPFFNIFTHPDGTKEIFDWKKVEKKAYKPEYIPQLSDDVDTRYFHRFYTDQDTESLVYKENKNKNKNKQSSENVYNEDQYDNESVCKRSEYNNFTYVNSVCGDFDTMSQTHSVCTLKKAMSRETSNTQNKFGQNHFQRKVSTNMPAKDIPTKEAPLDDIIETKSSSTNYRRSNQETSADTYESKKHLNSPDEKHFLKAIKK